MILLLKQAILGFIRLTYKHCNFHFSENNYKNFELIKSFHSFVFGNYECFSSLFFENLLKKGLILTHNILKN